LTSGYLAVVGRNSQVKQMKSAQASFGSGEDNGDKSLGPRFWRKLRQVLARIPFAADLLAAYYCALDRDTPLQVKATLTAAIAYFILPFDLIPDMLPVLGFTDDAVVLATAIKLVANHITPAHREAARRKLEEFAAKP
jgi:uncharacterized membrane protein YkvA (DUF1232 family)